MRNVLLLALLVPALALAVVSLAPVTVVAEDGDRPVTPVVQVDTKKEPGTYAPLIGTVDTIGGTTYDWQANALQYRYLVNSPDYGLHAAFMMSATGTPWSDRNMRYNFFDNATTMWNWIDPPDFMVSGVNTFVPRTGFGSLSASPSSGVAVISAHYVAGSGNLAPIVARDLAPGVGIFEYAPGDPVLDAYLWPPIMVSQDEAIQAHMIEDIEPRNVSWYSRCSTWPGWEPPAMVATPVFPTNMLYTSKVSNKVALTWVEAEAYPYIGFYRLSSDGGQNWDPPVEFEYPPAFSGGPDTTCSYYITSLNPFYDALDRFHIIVDVMPIWNDTVFGWPNEIWHWCPDNSPAWSKVHRADWDPYGSPGPGSNALLACRPMLGESEDGGLFAVWEQFDTLNVEPATDLLRADIFATGSNDGGLTWQPARKLTDGGTGSHRFPCIADLAVNTPDGVMVPVGYMIDQVAGSNVIDPPTGPVTNNPYVVQWVPADTLLAGVVGETPGVRPRRVELSARPNPATDRVVISFTLPRQGSVSLVVYDASGRPVRTLEQGVRQAGRYTVAWDGRAANGDEMAAGIYFYTLNTDDTSLTEKLIVVH